MQYWSIKCNKGLEDLLVDKISYMPEWSEEKTDHVFEDQINYKVLIQAPPLFSMRMAINKGIDLISKHISEIGKRNHKFVVVKSSLAVKRKGEQVFVGSYADPFETCETYEEAIRIVNGLTVFIGPEPQPFCTTYEILRIPDYVDANK